VGFWTTIVAGIVVVALTVIARKTITWWRAPRLHLDYEAAQTGEIRVDVDAARSTEASLFNSGGLSVSSSTTTGTGDLLTSSPSALLSSSPTPPKWRWYHLVVKNYGKTSASACSGFLDILLEHADARTSRASGWMNRLPLRWANTGGETEISIDPSQAARLDLVRIALQDSVVIEFVGAQAHVGLPTVYQRLGKWRALVVVESENATTARCLFEIDISRGPDRIQVRKIPMDLMRSDGPTA
jgi:hypothetical protein